MICRHPWLAFNFKIITTRQALNLKILYSQKKKKNLKYCMPILFGLSLSLSKEITKIKV